MTIAATNDGAAGALFQSTVQAAGVDVSHLGPLAQVQLALASIYSDTPPGSVAAGDISAGIFGANIPTTDPYSFPGTLNLLGVLVNLSTAGAAFAFTGTTVANVADTASGAITFKANIGRGTGAVGGFVVQVPMLGSTGTTAQTLANVLVLDSISTTGNRACFDGSEVLPSGISGTTGMNARGVRAFGLAGGGVLSVRRINGTLAVPTIIGNAETLGTLSFSGCMSATVLYAGASVVATSTEAWVNATSGGTQLAFNVTPNTTGTIALGMTLGQDKSLTVVGKFGCNAATAQAAATIGAALGAYGAGVNGYDSAGLAQAIYNQVVAMAAALKANGIAVT